MPSARPFCADESRATRRAALRHREPRRPLAPRRVPVALEPRRVRRQRALRAGQVRTCASSRPREPRTRLLFIRSRARRGVPGLLAYSATSREARGRAAAAVDSRHTTDLLERRSGGRRRRSGRPPAPARVHARQARPVLRALRPPALRRARRRGRARLGLAVARTWAAIGSPATSCACRTASTTAGSSAPARRRCWTSSLAERVYLDPYRGRSCYSFAVQAAERAIRARHGAARARRPQPRRRAPAPGRRLDGRDRPRGDAESRRSTYASSAASSFTSPAARRS